jgi:hypothetical protein
MCVKICVLFAVTYFDFSISNMQFTYNFNVSFFILYLTFLELLCSVFITGIQFVLKMLNVLVESVILFM